MECYYYMELRRNAVRNSWSTRVSRNAELCSPMNSHHQNHNPDPRNAMYADSRPDIGQATVDGGIGRAMRRCALTLCLMIPVVSAQAWNGLEHMMTAKIAYDRLN